MSSLHNEGVYMPNGIISNSAVAGGRNATAINIIETASTNLTNGGREQIAVLLEDLKDALVSADAELGDASDDAYEQTAAVAEELQRQEPRKSVVTRLLRGIAEDARDAASVVNAVQALAQAVDRLLP
jgi:hypothetical protein